MTNLLRALAVFLAALPLASHGADQTEQLFAFARANAGKFAQEIKETPGVVRVRFAPIRYRSSLAKFDMAAGKYIDELASLESEVWLFQRCKPDGGAYVGQNAFGASAKVQRQSCERMTLADSGETASMDLFNDELCEQGRDLCDRRLALPMTPDQYRAVRAQGFLFEVEFAVGVGAKQEVVGFTRFVGTPKVSDPVERRVSVWKVSGEVRSVTFLSHDGKTAFGTVVLK